MRLARHSCRCVCKVLASMSKVLEATKAARDKELEGLSEEEREEMQRDSKVGRLRQTRATEVRLVRHARILLEPEFEFEAVELRA